MTDKKQDKPVEEIKDKDLEDAQGGMGFTLNTASGFNTATKFNTADKFVTVNVTAQINDSPLKR